MERGKAIVIDASIAVKWFNAEEYSDTVDELKSKHINLQIDLSSPQVEWMKEAAEIAYLHGITIYDACYIALAKHFEALMYITNMRLMERVKDSHLKHISEAKTTL